MARRKRRARPQKYDPEFRVKVVKTAMGRSLSIEEIFKGFGVRPSSWSSWKRIYLERGEDGLRQYGQGRRRRKALSDRDQVHAGGALLPVRGHHEGRDREASPPKRAGAGPLGDPAERSDRSEFPGKRETRGPQGRKRVHCLPG